MKLLFNTFVLFFNIFNVCFMIRISYRFKIYNYKMLHNRMLIIIINNNMLSLCDFQI